MPNKVSRESTKTNITSAVSVRTGCVRLKFHQFDTLWIRYATSRAVNLQQIEQKDFEPGRLKDRCSVRENVCNNSKIRKKSCFLDFKKR